jgi:hypothetical protein
MTRLPWFPAFVTSLAVTGLAADPVAAQREPHRLGCADHHSSSSWGSERLVRHCEERAVPVARATGTLVVDATPNGAITALGGDGDSTRITAIVETFGTTDADARALAAAVRVTADGAVRADGPAERHRAHWLVSFVLHVPHRRDLRLTAENGGLDVSGVAGTLDLETENGPVTLDDIGGTAHVRSQNGPVDITLSGTRWNGTGLDAQTQNGPVTLSIPATYAAHVEASTVNGPLETDYPITLQGHIDPRRLAVDVGGGGPSIRVATTNGPLTISRE